MSRGARIFVFAFLIAFALAGFLRVEAWPLTGWQLFSHARRPVQTSWQAVTADASGAEHPLPLSQLGRAYSGTTHVLARFDDLPDSRRLAACDAWREGAERFGPSGRVVRAVRIYRITRDVSQRRGDRGAPPLVRELRYICEDGRVIVNPL